jgi:uncharacterized protein YbbC (DUF1343 family)
MKNGVDRFLETPPTILGRKKIGLITNQTGITRNITSNIDAFKLRGDIELKVVFGPEHGFQGYTQDALPVEDQIDSVSGIQQYSLYGKNLKPTADMLDGIDTLIFDIQDIGTRFYTYSSTMKYSLQAASENGIEFIVLDRPNPINGTHIEGCILEKEFQSFIGLHPIPIRHGLTIGEIAKMANKEIEASLKVIKIEGWRRSMWFDETNLPWVQPSPNIPTPETTIVYPGTCFFEGVNISEGRGTTRPFEYIGAPWIEGKKWASILNNLNLNGVRFRHCYFKPTFEKYNEELCGGVQIHVVNRHIFKPVEVGLYMLTTVYESWPEDFKWLSPRAGSHYHFDLLAGTDKVRKSINNGIPVEEIAKGWDEELKTYKKSRKRYLLYKEDH